MGLSCCGANDAAAVNLRGQVEKIFPALSAPRRMERIMVVMERSTVSPKPAAAFVRTAADAASAIHALTDVDLLRLKALARLWSRGLPGGLGWTDVLHEAIARVLDGSRPWPAQVPILPFLSGVMRSICDDHWRRVRHERRLLVSRDDPNHSGAFDHTDDVPDPERVVVAVEVLTDVYRLFEGDPLAMKVIAGMADGLTAREICRAYGLSDLDYDTTRRRMRRTLLRHQRNWSAW
jgi:DNA-directed RNA polymerase specialized sigma24 family protein